jgi:hypothetical protein
MVLFAIAELFLDTSVFITKKTFNFGYWMIYGTQKSPTEKLLEEQLEQNKKLECDMLVLHNDMVLITRKLVELENKISEKGTKINE